MTMQILVKSAHTFQHMYVGPRLEHSLVGILPPRALLTPNIIWPPVCSPNRRHLQVLDQEWLEQRKYDNVQVEECKLKDDDILSTDTLVSPNTSFEIVRRSLPLTVEPTLKIGALKSMLKPHPWIAKTNLLLVHPEGIPLENDHSSLEECGISDKDTLLACMGGSFLIDLYCENHKRAYLIPISSCFETVGDVKDKITLFTGYSREDQTLWYKKLNLDDKDETRLVSLGIVRPYLVEMAATNLLIMINTKVLRGRFR